MGFFFLESAGVGFPLMPSLTGTALPHRGHCLWAISASLNSVSASSSSGSTVVFFPASPSTGLQSYWSDGIFACRRATSNTILDSFNYQLAFCSSQGIRHVFPLISLGYAIDQRYFKLRIGELLASYITLYKHNHFSERLLKRDFHWTVENWEHFAATPDWTQAYLFPLPPCSINRTEWQ